MAIVCNSTENFPDFLEGIDFFFLIFVRSVMLNKTMFT